VKIKKSIIAGQVQRLRDLPTQADPFKQDRLITAVEELLARECRDEAHLKSVVDRCIETCKFQPVPAEVAEVIRVLAADRVPEWKPQYDPKDARPLTLQEMLEDMEALVAARPTGKMSDFARKRIEELKREMAQQAVAQ
jgi:hypothetical protein